MNNSRS